MIVAFLAIGAIAAQFVLALSLAVQQARRGFIPKVRHRAPAAQDAPHAGALR